MANCLVYQLEPSRTFFYSRTKMHMVYSTLLLILNLYVIDGSFSSSLDGNDGLPRMENSNIVDVPALIAQDNYAAETHEITTEDGYILTVHRIPGPPGAKAVLLQHGFVSCSANWLITGRGKSLAYILSDLGYDVWLGNSRGNAYSRTHVNLTTSDPKFWGFGWDELAMYDLPAVITYITDLKKDKLFFIGHSLGGSTFAAMASEMPKVAQRVKLMIGLAPAVYTNGVRYKIIRLLAPHWKEIQSLTKLLGIYELRPRNSSSHNLLGKICRTILNTSDTCNFEIGPYLGTADSSLQVKIRSTFPAGASMKLAIHFGQQITGTTFPKFDYGTLGNLKMYNSTKPPDYDMSKVRVPMTLFHAPNDRLVIPENVKRLYKDVPIKSGIYGVNDEKFSHLDFVWGSDVAKLVYSKIIEIMGKFRKRKTV